MHKFETYFSVTVSLFVVIAILISITISVSAQFNSNTYVGTVTEKVVKNSKDESRYLIFTELEDENVKVFEDTDSKIRGKFDSSDLYGKIKKGHKYQFNVYGYRIPFLSQYENIIDVKEIK